MKLPCSVEVVLYGVDLKARSAKRCKLIVRFSKQEARCQTVNPEFDSRPQNANSKKQSVKNKCE